MNGTEWTEPGQGATVDILRDEVIAATCREKGDCFSCRAVAAARRRVHDLWADHRTNIRLTGAPLTAKDLKRIAEAR